MFFTQTDRVQKIKKNRWKTSRTREDVRNTTEHFNMANIVLDIFYVKWPIYEKRSCKLTNKVVIFHCFFFEISVFAHALRRNALWLTDGRTDRQTEVLDGQKYTQAYSIINLTKPHFNKHLFIRVAHAWIVRNTRTATTTTTITTTIVQRNLRRTTSRHSITWQLNVKKKSASHRRTQSCNEHSFWQLKQLYAHLNSNNTKMHITSPSFTTCLG